MKKKLALLTFMPALCFGQWLQIGNDINALGAEHFFRRSTDGSIVASVER
jgi:hypothetical protein